MLMGGLEFRLSCRGFGKFRLINFFVDREAIFFSGLQWFDVDYRFLAGLLGCSVFVLSPFQKRTPDSRPPESFSLHYFVAHRNFCLQRSSIKKIGRAFLFLVLMLHICHHISIKHFKIHT